MPKLLRFLPLLALMLAGPAAAKEWTSITIATEGAFPPYNFHAPDGSLAGFEIDYAKVLCERAKLECKVVAQDWDGIIPGLLAGKYDAIMSGMSITPKRMEVISFTGPYIQSPTTFAISKEGGGSLPMTGQRVSLVDIDAARKQLEPLRAALKGKIIGVQVSTIQADLMNTFFKDVAEIRTYKTVEEHNLDLVAGRVDVVCSSAAVLTAALEKQGEGAVIAGPLVSGGMTGIGSGVGLRKADGDLRDKLNAAIQAAAADGTTRALYQKWFKLDLTPQP